MAAVDDELIPDRRRIDPGLQREIGGLGRHERTLQEVVDAVEARRGIGVARDRSGST